MRGRAGAGTASGGAVFGPLAWPRTFPRGVEVASRRRIASRPPRSRASPPPSRREARYRPWAAQREVSRAGSQQLPQRQVVAWRPAPSHAHGRARAVEGSKWVLKPCYAHARAVPRRSAAHPWCLHSRFFHRSTHTYRQKGQCLRVHQRISTRFGLHDVEARD